MGPTVSVENTSSNRVLHMLFQHHITEDDLRAAFQEITLYLDHTADPLYVIVDLRARPNFLISATIDGALQGPFRHPRLAAWLMLGHSRRGRVIANVMCNIAKRRNVLWFSSEEDTSQFLNNLGIELATLAPYTG